jgi:hypothetical protein
LKEVTALSFYPVGQVPSEKKDCTHGGKKDVNCEWDKLEACLITHYCLNGNCTTDVTVKVVDFLGCFAGDHGSDKSVQSATDCAGTAGLDFAPVQACYDKDGGEAAYKTTWDAASATQWFAQEQCVPWVAVGGKLFSDTSTNQCVKHGDVDRLVRAICDSYQGDPPAACKKEA